MKTAVITGVTGQDGSYLAELLAAEGMRVIGVARRTPAADLLPAAVEFLAGDVNDSSFIVPLIQQERPDEIYHLAGSTVVQKSWDDPGSSLQANALGAAHILEAARQTSHPTRVMIATSSEVFGAPAASPQNESTMLAPVSPYGVAKAAALMLARAYRSVHDVFAASAILFNHESPRRPRHFVTRKITTAAAAISLGRESELRLGNLEAKRDWGYAGDYVRAMRLILNHRTAEDFVIGTGEPHSIHELCDIAFSSVGLDYRRYVISDPTLFRPVDPSTLVADAERARNALGWRPTTTFRSMIEEMTRADLARLKAGLA